jgi:hypothetical protein
MRGLGVVHLAAMEHSTFLLSSIQTRQSRVGGSLYLLEPINPIKAFHIRKILFGIEMKRPDMVFTSFLKLQILLFSSRWCSDRVIVAVEIAGFQRSFLRSRAKTEQGRGKKTSRISQFRRCHCAISIENAR